MFQFLKFSNFLDRDYQTSMPTKTLCFGRFQVTGTSKAQIFCNVICFRKAYQTLTAILQHRHKNCFHVLCNPSFF